MEGVLYCKPHFEQLFKEAGNYNKNFQSRKSFFVFSCRMKVINIVLSVWFAVNFIVCSCQVSREVNSTGKSTLQHCLCLIWVESCIIGYYLLIPNSLCWSQTRSPSKAAGMFSGTQDKCATCGKTAYPLEKVKFEYLIKSLCWKCIFF